MKNKIVIVVSKFNKLITDELLAGVLEELNNQSVNEKNVQNIEVPGALEIPGIEGIIKPGAWTISGEEGSERKQQGKLE